VTRFIGFFAPGYYEADYIFFKGALNVPIPNPAASVFCPNYFSSGTKSD
jgi:hypothetical protein